MPSPSLLRNTLAGALLGCATLLGGFAQAASVQVAGVPPVSSMLLGTSSDTSGPPLTTLTTSFSGNVSRVDWWGYDLLQPQGGSTDDFVVKLGGQTLSGSLTRSLANTISDPQVGDIALFQYSLTLASLQAFSGAQSLEVSNQSFDVEWYWQGGSALALAPSYAVYVERDGQVPEPAALGLVLAALLGAGLARRR